MTDHVTTEPPVRRLLDDIADQFRHRPIDAAAPEIAAHIRQFWDPRMRAQLLEHVRVPTGDALLDAVIAAL